MCGADVDTGTGGNAVECTEITRADTWHVRASPPKSTT